ncbi:MAG: hypothetical protein HY851_01325 [candidate division Zixibacteria bacterium]|nr:hypothetical protein [candidate division Zixibacteria bacterium]
MTSYARISAVAIVCALTHDVSAQVRTAVSDTTRPPDTTRAVDTTVSPRTPSKLAERIAKSRRKSGAPQLPQFSFQDTLRGRFCSERYNQKPAVDRAFFRSTADYFRYSPQFFVLPYQETPLRTTVAPFGLTNSRVNWVLSGMPVTLFEHVPEMDGMADAEDLPTTGDQSAYLLPGPVGLLFGGDQATATLVAAPESLSTTDAHSTMFVDKGTDDYAMTRGRYAKRFGSGRRVDLSIGYRNVGAGYLTSDDTYHYAGDIYEPIGSRWGLRTEGWLYTRDGKFEIGSPLGMMPVGRYRFERHAAVSLMRADSAHRARTEVRYEHARQGSHYGSQIGRWFDQIGHGVSANREWISGAAMFRIRGQGNILKYDNGVVGKDRTTGDLSVSMIRPVGGFQTAVAVGSRYDKDFKALPYAVVTALRERRTSLLNLSLGYAERAPTMHELYLPYIQSLLVSGGLPYADSGNTGLVKEKQLVGSMYGELGTRDNAIGVSATGGRIENAVEWVRQVGPAVTLHTPVNVTRQFSAVSASARFRITDVARFHAGAGYSHVDRTDNRPRYYAPETQAFAGLELHWNWTQKLVHLRGYGELVYTGPYHGYVEEDLGDRVLANGTVSFQMGGFRFFYVFRNMFDIQYDSRDYMPTLGRYVSYGFVWNFLN